MHMYASLFPSARNSFSRSCNIQLSIHATVASPLSKRFSGRREIQTGALHMQRMRRGTGQDRIAHLAKTLWMQYLQVSVHSPAWLPLAVALQCCLHLPVTSMMSPETHMHFHLKRCHSTGPGWQPESMATPWGKVQVKPMSCS